MQQFSPALDWPFRGITLLGSEAFYLLIPLSRLYLGVHFPVDLAGGYLIGGVLVWGFLKAEDPVAHRLASFRLHTLLGLWNFAGAPWVFSIVENNQPAR